MTTVEILTVVDMIWVMVVVLAAAEVGQVMAPLSIGVILTYP